MAEAKGREGGGGKSFQCDIIARYQCFHFNFSITQGVRLRRENVYARAIWTTYLIPSRSLVLTRTNARITRCFFLLLLDVFKLNLSRFYSVLWVLHSNARRIRLLIICLTVKWCERCSFHIFFSLNTHASHTSYHCRFIFMLEKFTRHGFACSRAFGRIHTLLCILHI